MRNGARVSVIIPAFNEEQSIGKVLDAIPEWVDRTIVVDNASTDRTAQTAQDHGAHVVAEPQRGYGAACLRGIASLDDAHIAVFLDADFSDHPEEMERLVDSIIGGRADMVIGSRVRGNCDRGALTPQARYGNWLACTLIRLFWNVDYTDPGPFRAIRCRTLKDLDMQDRDFGWTVEMQVKAAQRGVRVMEEPVSYRKRIGRPKISGTVRGVSAAGTKILYTIFREALWTPRGAEPIVRNHLGVFARYPKPGSTKTRLIPALGAEGAAELHGKMAAHTLLVARQARQTLPIHVEVHYDGGKEDSMPAWLGPDLAYRAQCEGDLGTRMHEAFSGAFLDGMERAVLIGTDCPELTAAILTEAFARLHEHDAVLGPAHDGGYYLVGLRRPVPELFSGVAWGTHEVLEQTLAKAHELGLSVAQLPVLADVDRPEDLAVWKRVVGEQGSEVTVISVIIPILNEADAICSCIASARKGEGVEIIVVDGGSDDNGAALAERYGARVISSEQGRARQMNAGAQAASGDVLVFLHADTLLPEGYSRTVRETLALPDTVAGAFRLKLDADSPTLRLIEKGTNLRAKCFQWPYGDQALFLTRALFDQAGGYRDMAVMEDYELVRRLRKLGRIRLAPADVTTSSRRWLRRGALRLTLRHQFIIWAYRMGVSPDRLVRWR